MGMQRLKQALGRWAANRRRKRYERLKRKVIGFREQVVKDLQQELAETRLRLNEALIDNRLLKRVIEQQEFVINRDRHRVMQEIRDLGGVPDQQPNESLDK